MLPADISKPIRTIRDIAADNRQYHNLMKIILTHEQRTQLIEELTRGDNVIDLVAPGGPIRYRAMFMEISEFIKYGNFFESSKNRQAVRACNVLARNADSRFNDLSLDELTHFLKGSRFRSGLRQVGPETPAVLADVLAIDGVKRIVEKYTG